MILRSITAENIEPIKHIQISDMQNVVIIAGANGSGKSRLKDAIIQTFRNPTAPQVELLVEATRKAEEKERWGSENLRISCEIDNQQFHSYMQSRTRGGSYTGTVIQIDSQRSVNAVNFQPLTLATPDPDDAEMDYFWFLNSFTGRWNEIVNKIYQKAANRDYKIAQYTKEHLDGRNSDTLRLYPDPFIRYQELFAQLLPGKQLLPIDPKSLKEFEYKESDGNPLPFSSLSSGEQEVIRITFDLLSKSIKHCVFLIDEPELHLHPTLTFRLIETLKGMGNGTNQYIFFTHSADLISTYYSTGNVYFIDTQKTGANQAHRLKDLHTNHPQLVQAMSENLGLFAVGKKLVFVEGEHTSRDRPTYHAIAQNFSPEAYITSAGDVNNIMSFHRLGEELRKSIFGVSLFMIRDRDGLDDAAVLKIESSGHIKCLNRRHIENYFLDSEILAKVAARFCIMEPALNDAASIEQKLKSIAENSLGDALMLNLKEMLRLRRNLEIPTVKEITSKSPDSISDEFLEKTIQSLNELNACLSEEKLRPAFANEKKLLQASLVCEEWKTLFPGKLIFERYCGQQYLNQESTRVREAYVQTALAEKPEVFQDIIDIFQSFKALDGRT